MSVNQFLSTGPKPWMNVTVNDIIVNDSLVLPNLNPGIVSNLCADVNGKVVACSASGVLPVSGGGTGSSTALTGGKIMVSNLDPNKISEGTSCIDPIFNSVKFQPNPGTNQLSLSCSTLSGSYTINFPNPGANDVAVYNANTATLINKTLGSSILSGTTTLSGIAASNILQTNGSSALIGSNTLTSPIINTPTINTATINTSTISNATITGTTHLNGQAASSVLQVDSSTNITTSNTLSGITLNLLSAGSTQNTSLIFYSDTNMVITPTTTPWDAGQALSFKMSRLNDIVTLTFSYNVFAYVGTNKIIANAGVAPEFKPTSTRICSIMIVNNAVNAIGLLSIDNAGIMTIGQNFAQNAFTGTDVCGIPCQSVSYRI